MAHPLIAEFNTLGGSTRSQHYRNFSLFLKKLASLDPIERENIIDSLKIGYRQEELFYTKLLLKYEQVTRIKDIILRGDCIINRLIVNQRPFVFREDNVNFFMEHLFPNVSYIVRKKCIVNLAKCIQDDKVGEEFFKAIVLKYGIKTAFPLLTVCKEEFVREMISFYRIIFTERHLVRLHKRFGIDVISFYYKELSQYVYDATFGRHTFFAMHLSINDPQGFCQMIKYGKPKIGKQGCKNFLKIQKDAVIAKPQEYNALIKKRILYRMLTKDEFKQFLLNLIPKSVDQFDFSVVKEYIKFAPIRIRGGLVAETFREKYACDIHDKYKERDDYYFGLFLQLLSKEDREKFKVKQDTMVEYCSPDKAFPLIKEQINLTSDINTRCDLILKLFKCAKFNDDPKALLSALQYFSARHKNDQSNIRETVFIFLSNNYKMEELHADAWKYIHEIILTEEVMSEYQHMLRDMLEMQISYKFTAGLDMMVEFKKYVKLMGFHYFVLPSKNKELRRWALNKMPEVCAEIFTEEDAMKRYPESFLNAIKTWNIEYPKDIISYYKFPDMIDRAVESYDGSYYNDILPTHVLKFKTEDPQENEKQMDLYLNKFEKFIQHSCFWELLLRNHPEIIEKHIKLIFDKRASLDDKFFNQVNKLHFTALPEKVRAAAIAALHDDSVEFNVKRRAITALSFETDFVQLISDEKYFPSGEAEIDLHEENAREITSLRSHVLATFNNVSKKADIIPLLLRFCFKDYFQSALPVLTKTLFNCPEKLISEPLKILADRSVTVRKRALFFSTSLCNAEESNAALKYAGENEKNISLQKFVFNRTLKNFINVCDQTSWELLIAHFKFVFEKDHETHSLVGQFKHIPRRYLSAYIEKVWNHLVKQWGTHYSSVLLAITDDVMPLLSDTLCDDIIYFNFTHPEQYHSWSNEYVYRYLILAGENFDHRFRHLMSVAKTPDEAACSDFREFTKKLHNISALYEDLCKRLITDKVSNKQAKLVLTQKLEQSFAHLPLPYNRIEYLHLIEIAKCLLADESSLPGVFVKLQKSVIVAHGDLAIQYFNKFVSEQLSVLSEGNVEYILNFVEKLLDVENSDHVKLLALNLLPCFYPSELNAMQFEALLNKINTDATDIVMLYLNCYMKTVSV